MTDGEPANRFVATGRDGRMVAQMHDIEATVIGYVDAKTGRLHSPDKRPLDDHGETPAAGRVAAGAVRR